MKKYILGFLTGVCFLPILDSVTELIQVALEVPKGKLSKGKDKNIWETIETTDLKMQKNVQNI